MLKNVCILKLCRSFTLIFIFHTLVACFHERSFTKCQIYFLLNTATRKKKNDKITNGCVLSSAAQK